MKRQSSALLVACPLCGSQVTVSGGRRKFTAFHIDEDAGLAESRISESSPPEAEAMIEAEQDFAFNDENTSDEAGELQGLASVRRQSLFLPIWLLLVGLLVLGLLVAAVVMVFFYPEAEEGAAKPWDEQLENLGK